MQVLLVVIGTSGTGLLVKVTKCGPHLRNKMKVGSKGKAGTARLVLKIPYRYGNL